MAQPRGGGPIGAEEIELEECSRKFLAAQRNAKVSGNAASTDARGEIAGTTRHRWNRYRGNNKRISQRRGSRVICEISPRRSVDTQDGAGIGQVKKSGIIGFQWSVVETRCILLISRKSLVIRGGLANSSVLFLRR